MTAGSNGLAQNLILTIASLASILLVSFHAADDVVRGLDPAGFQNIRAVLIVVVWLYGTLVLAGKKSGYIVILLGSLLGALMPLAHMRGAGLSAEGSLAPAECSSGPGRSSRSA
jgi:hypothetical protein